MFGYVTANWKELTKEQKDRYGSIYCGICRGIKSGSGTPARIALSYDMAFLATLLMSLYEPEEVSGKNACLIHPIQHRPWVDNDIIRYCADMNVALGYYNALDDWQDDGKHTAKWLAEVLGKQLPEIEARYPRQCGAIRDCITRLSQLEKENCPNPDEPAACFGTLMGELLVYKEDIWADNLRRMGLALGRFIYLLDAALDYQKDQKKGKYNPYIAMGLGQDWQRWEDYLVLTMGRCTQFYERLPLVQDKGLLDNILYSGVWVNYRGKRKEADQK
ncbi:MAG: DUF5685 family protein [Faecousia sp.]